MRYLLIGYGNIGRKRKLVLGDKCVAVSDPYQEDADYENYTDVPIDAYDAAIISTPNSVKLEILEYLLSNKKHALVEKPLLFNSYEFAETLDKLSKKNGIIWYTSYNHRFEPLVIKLKESLDAELIGQIYFSKLIYGNGTVQNSICTWRDTGYGVMEDLGCHLLDLAIYLFPNHCRQFRLVSAKSFEAKSPDYCTFCSGDGKLNFLCSSLMWKNTFKIDVFGSKGSIHLDGLNKWGGAALIHRERIFPSGVPKETIETSSRADETWKRDIAHFEKAASMCKSSYENDLHITQHIKALM